MTPNLHVITPAETPQSRLQALRAEMEALTLEQIDGALAVTAAARLAWLEVSVGSGPPPLRDRARRVAELFRVEGDGLRAMRDRIDG